MTRGKTRMGPKPGTSRVITRLCLNSATRNQWLVSSLAEVAPMHRHHSWSESGVSEVVGTILILAMTVVLFSGIILWVSNFPTPKASIRLDMDGKLIPIYQAGVWKGVNVTIEHKGGESLQHFRPQVFFSVLHNGVTTTALRNTHGTSSGIPSGLNGPDADW